MASAGQLPDWPRMLTREMAAAYVGVSVDVFDDEVRAGQWPAGRPRGAKGGRLTWDRKLLDAAEDRRSGLLAVPAGEEDVVDVVAADAWKERIRAATPQQRPERRQKAPA